MKLTSLVQLAWGRMTDVLMIDEAWWLESDSWIECDWHVMPIGSFQQRVGATFQHSQHPDDCSGFATWILPLNLLPTTPVGALPRETIDEPILWRPTSSRRLATQLQLQLQLTEMTSMQLVVCERESPAHHLPIPFG